MEIGANQVKILPSASELLREAWAIYKANIKKFIYLALIPFLFLAPSVFLGRSLPGVPSITYVQPPGLMVPFWILLIVLGVIAQLLFILSLIFIVKERQVGVAPREALKYAWGKLASYIWIWLLTTVIIVVGFLLFIVPGIIFAIWYCLAVYVLVAEEKRGTAALGRSRELVKGYWWKVLWRLIIIGIVAVIPILPFSFLADYGQRINLVWLEIIAGIFSLIVSFLIQGLSTSYWFLLYEKLKNIKSVSEIQLT